MLDLLTPLIEGAHTVLTQPATLVHSVDCPAFICNVQPDFTAFGPKFVALMSKGWAAAWGLVILISFFILLGSSLHLRSVNKKTDPNEKARARGAVMGALWGVGGAVLVPAIILILLSFFG